MTEMSTTAEVVAHDAVATAPPSEVGQPPVGRRRRRSNRPPIVVCIAIGWLALIVFGALFADILPLKDPEVDVGIGTKVRPFTDWSEPFGTDTFGRSEFTRIVFGSRLSLAAGLGSVLAAMLIGVIIGAIAGYRRGKIDWFIGVIIDALLSIPSLVMLLAITAVMTPSLRTVILGLTLIAWPGFARIARANTLRYANAEFVVAARGLGAKKTTILIREVLPSVFRSVSAFAAVIAAVLILAEASLSFLGLGVPPPTASWGNMISDGRQYLTSDPHLVFVPATALFLTILSMNTVGDWIRRRAGAGTVV
jgi:peptide/nickel transport system permease protein